MSITDGILTISDTRAGELPAIAKMEQAGDTAHLIIPYSLEKHRMMMQREDVFYKSIFDAEERMVGFMILVLDPDGARVEFRRLVIADRGKGYGRRAVALVDRICLEELGCPRIWLDVFADNPRARRLYETSGYRKTGESGYNGRVLRVYDKTLEN